MQYKVAEGRAALGARAVIGCTAIAALVFAALPPSLRLLWPRKLAVLAPIVCFLCSTADFGSTVKLALTFFVTVPPTLALSLGVAYLGFFACGGSWHPWMLRALAPIQTFVLVVWYQAAKLKQAPKAQIVGDPLVLFFSPLLLGILPQADTDLMKPLLSMASLSTVVMLGSAFAWIFSLLPFQIGAPSARQRVPLLTASKLYAVADYYEATALRHDALPSSLCRRATCRYIVLKATSALKSACASAEFEAFGAFRSIPQAAEDLRTHAESCRISLQLSHLANTKPFSDITQTILYHGLTGEKRVELAVAATRCLRAAGAVGAELGGKRPEPELPGMPELLQDCERADECREAAKACREALVKFQASFTMDTRDLLRAQIALPGSPQDQEEYARAFLRGDLHDSASEATHTPQQAMGPTDRRTAAFSEVCRSFTSQMAACSAAESAVQAAEAAACWAESTAEGSSVGCSQPVPGGVGLLSWLTAIFAGREVWREALKAGGRHAWRLSLGIFSASCLHMLIGNFIEFTSATWVVVTVGICITPVQGAAIVKAGRRLLGTLLGGIFSLISLSISEQPAVLWSHMVIVVFVLKFFDKELQYAGAVVFVTYIIVVAGVLSDEDGETNVLQVAGQRLGDVGMGVVISTLVSMFVAPDRAVDALRRRELEALQLTSDSVKAATRTLKKASLYGGVGAVTAGLAPTSIGPLPSEPSKDDDVSEHTDQMRQLVQSTWECVDALFFGGDGRPGTGDMLFETEWESKAGTDGGFPFCCGAFWLPEWCRPCGVCCSGAQRRWAQLATGQSCIKAVPPLGRLLRLSHIAMALLEPGIEPGAELLLMGGRVMKALGTDGIAHHVAMSAQALSKLLETPVAPCTGRRLLRRCCPMMCRRKEGSLEDEEAATAAEEGHATGQSEEDGRSWVSEDAQEALQRAGLHLLHAGRGLCLLFEGVAERREENGGLVNSEGPGGLRVAAVLFLFQEILTALGTTRECLARKPADLAIEGIPEFQTQDSDDEASSSGSSAHSKWPLGGCAGGGCLAALGRL